MFKPCLCMQKALSEDFRACVYGFFLSNKKKFCLSKHSCTDILTTVKLLNTVKKFLSLRTCCKFVTLV